MRFNSKIFATITLFFAVCCFMATSSWAARKIEFYSANAERFIGKLNHKDSFESISMGPILGLTQDEAFNLLRKRTDFNGVTHYRFQQSFRKIPLWGMHTIVSVDPANRVVRLHGAIILDIANDIRSIPASLDPQGALRRMQGLHKEKNPGAAWNFRNEKYGTYVYLHIGKAHLCFVVSFFADTECGNPSQPIFFVDVDTGKVLHWFDMLRYAEGYGPGGNLKVGYYYYGTDYPGFGVTEASGTCTMDTTDVKTVDLNHGTSGTTPFSYTCYENTHKEINGGYCPLNDAQYFGQVVYDMYNDWYGVPVLPFQLTLRCHYWVNYENAFWDGSTMTFGDGYTTFYPLVSLDVVSHEVSHGFTDYNSDLTYSGQSGGINEAFSDQAGEAAEYYSSGTTDYQCGFDIFKNPTQALRYLYDPPLDGKSIDHVDDYYDGMNVHYSSGIFNKAFYLIATSPGWDTQMAFDIFVKANQDYWQPGTNFQQGAEGARDAALDYGYPCQDVLNAFAVVGISISCPGPPVADFVGSPISGGGPLTVNFTDQSLNNPTSWSWSFGSTLRNPAHTFPTPGTYTVSLTAANVHGSDTETKTNYITVLPPQPPVADFTASSTDIPVVGSVTFTDQTLNAPTSWSWTFAGGTPGSSTAKNPTVTYNTLGTFTVTLTATNPQGIDTETKVDYITVSDKPYCTSSGENQDWEYIAVVEVGDLNNPSGPSPYSDFTSMVAHLIPGETVNVSLIPEFLIYPETVYWRIWIDYNGDHDFEDVGEKVFTEVGNSSVTGTFTVPSSASGTTRMRVSMAWYHPPQYPPPPCCGTFKYGEVEDYTVIFGPEFPAEPDFNNDGKADIIWRNYGPGGYNAVWLLGTAQGTTPLTDPRNDPQAVALLPDVADQNWKIGGTADFDGDGNVDIVWSNVSTLKNCVWYMNGTEMAGFDWLPTGASADWILGGLVDFNNDGKPDLVWTNSVTGENGVWYLDGVTAIDYVVMTTGGSLDWKLCGTGDFNCDGQVDLVWRNTVDGRNGVWYMDGPELSSVGWLDPIGNQDWELRGTGDFNGDGKTDLIWRNVSTGNNCIWYLDGVNLTGVEFLTQVINTPDTAWTIEN